MNPEYNNQQPSNIQSPGHPTSTHGLTKKIISLVALLAVVGGLYFVYTKFMSQSSPPDAVEVPQEGGGLRQDLTSEEYQMKSARLQDQSISAQIQLSPQERASKIEALNREI